jgi:hypothetical protein
MFITDPLDALLVARTRADELRAEAAAERLHGASGTRRAIALSLRRAADLLDPRPAVIPTTHVNEA